MFRKILLPTIFVILGYGFWISQNFEEIVAGVAIFLFGMIALEEGFRAFSGGILEKILKKSTNKLYKSISLGFVATTLMQSSSLISVLTISFLGAGLIGLVQGIGIIYGANIGTTTGSWLMAGFGLKVKISAYAMPMLVFGIIMIFQKSKSIKGLGYILTGLGFLFLGIHYMKEGFEAFKDGLDLASFGVGGFRGLLIFILVGIIATIIMQSSHATIILVITALSVGQITYENAIAITIGANIGTTITAILGSLSSNIEGKRLAGAHFIFNVLTALVAIAFIPYIISFVNFISSAIGISDDDFTLKLAVFDTFFKTMGVVLMIPWTNKLVWFLENFIKAKKVKLNSNEIAIDETKYLNDSVLELPETAFISIIKETKHLYDNAFEIIASGLNVQKNNIISTMDLDEVMKYPLSDKIADMDILYNNKIKGIYGDIIDFSTRAQSNMTKDYVTLVYKVKLANRDLVDAIKDTKHLQKNLKKYLNSPNEAIRKEYDAIRKNIVALLRDINIIATTSEEDVIVLLLSKVKMYMKQNDIIANGKLDSLIRNNLISNEMATSLMNDSAYATNIIKKLISMAEVVFVISNDDIKNVSEDILVNDDDIEYLTIKRRQDGH